MALLDRDVNALLQRQDSCGGGGGGIVAWSTDTPRSVEMESTALLLTKMLPQAQYPEAAARSGSPRKAIVQASVCARKGLVLRADAAKESARVGTVTAGAQLAVFQLARTRSGTVRALTPAGWATLPPRTQENVCWRRSPTRRSHLLVVSSWTVLICCQ